MVKRKLLAVDVAAFAGAVRARVDVADGQFADVVVFVDELEAAAAADADLAPLAAEAKRLAAVAADARRALAAVRGVAADLVAGAVR